MPRRVNLPGASELFRPTQGVPEVPRPAERAEPVRRPRTARPDGPEASAPRVSGRVRHEEKITVYVSSDELLALEQARLQLRAEHRLAVDRGRIVRAAVAAALADLAEHGAGSELVRRLDENAAGRAEG
ncbi:hypothetical protein DT076_03300 [Desertihabitans brevis]|uniref:Cobyrinic acid a,c-diamide synthase n=1 Tax=Desertihabitans brevis TaxID=2268447 RepID=A0A367Z0Y2_9ACTN|nr:hypothetical protein [Desertihabitans brevis]RCK71449.1 hypothetical protein DT076_03300 [Desertihabitans brevis]